MEVRPVKDFNLFDSVDELRASLRKLEAGCDDTASALRTRLAAQERAIPDLRKFGRGVDARQYMAAREMIVAVAAHSMSADRLEVLMLRLECEFVKRKARADRSRSSSRFDAFYEVFDGLVTGRRCSSAADAHKKAAAAAQPPHPMPSVSRKRYGLLRQDMGVC